MKQKPNKADLYAGKTERARIEAKRKAAGCRSMSSWLRKAALEGLGVNLDLPEVREMTRQLQSCEEFVNSPVREPDGERNNRNHLESVRSRLAKIRALQGKLLKSLAPLRSRKKKDAEEEERTEHLQCWLSDEELEQIEKKRKELGFQNLSAFLRRMALEGYTVHLNLTELRTLTRGLRACTDGVIRFLREADAAGISPKDGEDLRSCLDDLWDQHRKILGSLGSIE